ncbi:hypothetical protein VKT23_013108 [Stygiomarasmius scandens]|uniref:Uncharacterized protein n=1 Tax=Marasmiellus scandens TaxID=2682957 RepID=A0ABR1J3M3_9AGAR
MYSKRQTNLKSFILVPGTFILIFLIQHIFFRDTTLPRPSTLRIEGQWKQVHQALGLPPLQDEIYFSSADTTRVPLPSRFFKRHLANPERDSDELAPNSNSDTDGRKKFTFSPPPTLFFAQDALHEPKLSTEQLIRSFELAALRDEREARSNPLALTNLETVGVGNRQRAGKKGGRGKRTV